MYSKLIGPLFGGKLAFPLSVVPTLRNISCSQLQQEWAVPKKEWDSAISEAERMVGYSTSFLSLPQILSAQFATFATHVDKLAASNHPLLSTAKYIIYDGRNTLQVWGTTILLISKAAGHAPDMEQDKIAEILHSQRVLAESIETMRIAHWMHQSIVNLHLFPKIGEGAALYNDMALGNKISLLSGDYLASHAGKKIAGLKNLDLVELLYSAVRGIVEAEFFGERDGENNPLPSNPLLNKRGKNDVVFDKDLVQGDLPVSMGIETVIGVPEKEWEFRNIQGAGNLLGKGCQGALKLAGQPEELQQQANLFGRHLSLAWQAHLDAKPFQISILPFGETFSMVSAPILFHLEHDPSLYTEIEKGKTSVDNINYDEVHSEVRRGPGLEETKKLQRKHAKAAIDILETFAPSDARTVLQNIILAMEDF